MEKGSSSSKSAANNRSNQMNPNNSAYSSSRSGGSNNYNKSTRDNRCNQLNPNNDVYHSSRKQSNSHNSTFSSSADESLEYSKNNEDNDRNKIAEKIKKNKKGIGLLAAGGILGFGLIKALNKKK